MDLNSPIFNQLEQAAHPLPASQEDQSEVALALRGLETNQLRYIALMLNEPALEKQEAARRLGLARATIYAWPEQVDRALHLIALDYARASRAIMRQYLVKAVMVKLAGLDSPSEKIRQTVATEIIEWVMGRPKQQTDISATVDIHDYRNEIFDKLFKGLGAGEGEGEVIELKPE